MLELSIKITNNKCPKIIEISLCNSRFLHLYKRGFMLKKQGRKRPLDAPREESEREIARERERVTNNE